MVRTAKDWPWSSYKSTAGFTQLHPALTTDWILGNFGKQRKKAQDGYKAFVREGKNQPSPWEYLKNQIYLGSDKFVEDMQCKLDPDQSLEGMPKPQKMSLPKPLRYYEKKYIQRDEAMAIGYRSGHYTLQQVGEYFGKSTATVSRAVKEYESQMNIKCKT